MAVFLESADDNLMAFFDQPDGLDYSDVFLTGS
jgi:ethanolamine utilization microcompartment shell protein EutL